MASFNDLSNELIILVGEFCPIPDLARLARTQRRCNGLLNSMIYKRNIHDEPPHESCVLYAAAYKRMDILKKALAHGADMNGPPLPPRTPAANPRSRARRGQRGNFCTTMMRYNREYIVPRPLHIAVWNDDEEMVRFLLENGAVTDVEWFPTDDSPKDSKYDHTKQILPSFLDGPRLLGKPLPPSGIRPDLTLDSAVYDVNSILPSHSTYRRMLTAHSLQVEMARGLRHTYPIIIACSLPESSRIGSLLVERGARLANGNGGTALCHAIYVGNITMFDELIGNHPESDLSRDGALYKALRQLEYEAHDIPLDMMRHAFIRLWRPDLPLLSADGLNCIQNSGMLFFSIVTGRFREALMILNGTEDQYPWRFSQGEFTAYLLHYIWLDGFEYVGGDNGVRWPDAEPLATKLDLTASLLARGVDTNWHLRVSHSSSLHLTPLYQVAVGSAVCPYRFKAMRLLLENGAQQRYIVSYTPDQRLSLLRYFLTEAAQAQDLDKFNPCIMLCLEYGARLNHAHQRPRVGPERPGELEFSITAWAAEDGTYPLFDFLLSHASSRNIDVNAVKLLLGKDIIRNKPAVRDALFEFAEVVLNVSVAAVGSPPPSVFGPSTA